MKKIKLTQGKFAIVDDDDFNWLNSFKWAYGNRGYAYRRALVKCKEIKNSYDQKIIYMHKFILGEGNIKKSRFMGDHINGNKLDNRKKNLRFVNACENARNSKVGFNLGTSNYKGVGKYPNKKGKWRARICVNNKSKCLGYFSTEIEAALAYDVAAIFYFGEFAKTNFHRNYPKDNIKVSGINYDYRKEMKTSKYRGVSKCITTDKWRVMVYINGRTEMFGSFSTELVAAKRYDIIAKKYFGEFAKTNFEYENERFKLNIHK